MPPGTLGQSFLDTEFAMSTTRKAPDSDAVSIHSNRSGRGRSRRNTQHYPAMPSHPHSTYQTHLSEFGMYPSSRPTSRHSAMSFSKIEDPVMMAKVICRRALLLGWFNEQEASLNDNAQLLSCVAIKDAQQGQGQGQRIFMPQDTSRALMAAMNTIDEAAIMTMSSELSQKAIDTIVDGQKCLMIESTGARIPIVPSLGHVVAGLAHTSSSCVVLKERLVLLWSHEPESLINLAHETESQLFDLVSDDPNAEFPVNPFEAAERMSIERGGLDEKNEIYMKAVAIEEGEGEDEVDLEATLPPRPIARVNSVSVSIAMMLVVLTQFAGISKLLNQYWWDGNPLRFILLVTVPPLTLFSLFFFIVLVGSLFQLLVPSGICLKNTKFHSAIKPNPKRHRDYELPHITVQMPVYKEGLKGVLVPTIVSVMKAIQHYEELGGTASVFVNDDGMQLLQPELAEARRQYYRENGIGYTARLPTCKRKAGADSWTWPWSSRKAEVIETNIDDWASLSPQQMSNRLKFERKGKFKKASNMNYGLAFSLRVEDEVLRLQDIECRTRGCALDDLTVEDDDRLYEQALENMIGEDRGRTWAEGNIRIGELIMIIDCDTRVPEDCLLYGALELHESPEVAILQHGSGVMQVVHNTFENGITYFTNLVYSFIKYGVGTGIVSPFVGHNSFIRWKSLQSIAFVDESDGLTKWWSDSHVSEDFDISLRLQMQGMTIRLATYHNGGFKEGVSLTLYDELARWEKYAYGCNELVFHPLHQWIYKGPVTKLFLRFLWSNIPVTSKVVITAYIFTYYAIGSALFLAVINYFVIGLFSDVIDHIYQPSWGVWLSVVVIFNASGTIAFAMTRHQLKERPFFLAIWDAVYWLPFLVVFFSGISLNCAKALLCHAFCINIEWASTAKEIGPTGFYIGLEQMVRSFRWTWVICFVLTGVAIYFAVGAPWGWTIRPSIDPTGTSAFAPLLIQICGAFFLPIFLGFN